MGIKQVISNKIEKFSFFFQNFGSFYVKNALGNTNYMELSVIVQIHFIELPKIEEILKKHPKDLSEIEFWTMLITLRAIDSLRQEDL